MASIKDKDKISGASSLKTNGTLARNLVMREQVAFSVEREQSDATFGGKRSDADVAQECLRTEMKNFRANREHPVVT